MLYVSLCPNCKNPIPRVENGRVVDSHVDWQIDCVTGDSFVPVARIVNNQVTELYPEDYICDKRS